MPDILEQTMEIIPGEVRTVGHDSTEEDRHGRQEGLSIEVQGADAEKAQDGGGVQTAARAFP
jgi:hypothetical protein